MFPWASVPSADSESTAFKCGHETHPVTFELGQIFAGQNARSASRGVAVSTAPTFQGPTCSRVRRSIQHHPPFETPSQTLTRHSRTQAHAIIGLRRARSDPGGASTPYKVAVVGTISPTERNAAAYWNSANGATT